MPWMVPAVIAAMTGAIVLALVYLYLFEQDRRPFLRVWCIGWAIYSLRFCFMLLTLAGKGSRPVDIAYYLSAVISGLFLIWGAYMFLGRRMPRIWGVGSLLCGLWVVTSVLSGLPFPAIALPTFTFLAAISIWAGIIFLRHRELSGLGRWIVGGAFILWGLHKGDYPFLRSVEWFAPWGYLIGATLELVVAIGVILLYFEKIRGESRTSEALLRESETKYRALFQSAGDAIFILNGERLVDCNERALAMFRGSRVQIVGSALSDFFPELQPNGAGSRDAASVKIAEAVAGKPQFFEWRHKRLDGTSFESEVSLTSIALGGETYIQAIIRDITARKNLEEALNTERRRLFSLLDELPAFVYLLAPDHTIHYANKYFRKQFGEPTNRPCYAVIRKGEDACDYCPTFSVFESGLPQTWERQSGDGKTYQIYDYPFTDVDGSGLVLQLGIDITERKQAEEALAQKEELLRKVLETLPVGVWIIDGEGNIIHGNPAGQRIWAGARYVGIDRYGEYKGWWLKSGKRIEPAQWAVTRAIAKGETSVDEEIEIECFDGSRKMILQSAAPILDDRQRITGAIVVNQDITASRKAEEERRKLEEQLRQAQKMEAVGQLAGGISHDFNNILCAIIGYGNLLQLKMRPDDEMRVNVEQILEAADRAAALTHSLLAFSRKQTIDPKPTNLNEIISRMGRLLDRLIGEDIELRTSLGEEELHAVVDSGQIEQVLMNLVTNARDAMPRGGALTVGSGLIELDDTFIKVHGYGEPGTYALITVTDNGSGMDEATKQKIFEPFFTTKDVGKGTGLGLAMVYGIVKQHKGYINVYSEPGKGTTFKIYLPAIEPAVKVKGKTGAAVKPVGGHETVLVAEDDAALREFMMIVLNTFGYKAITAEDGEDAVRKFKEHKDEIRLVVLDVVMPKKGGREAGEEIRRIRPDIKILFSSGYTADLICGEGIPESADFIMKPVSPQKFLRKVREVLDK